MQEITAKEILDRLVALRVRDVASIRAVRRDFSKRLAKRGGGEVMRIALSIRDNYFVAGELVQKHSAAMALVGEKQLAAFGEGMSSWGDVDCFARLLAGPAWQANQITDGAIHKWARSEDRWWRRSALVATVELNRPMVGARRTNATSRTLRVCRMLAADRDDMVVKAMSWALRELAKTDPAAVRTFLTTQKDLAPRVIRETSNKLRTGLKNPRDLCATLR